MFDGEKIRVSLPGAGAPNVAALDGSIIEVRCWAHVRRKFFEPHVAAKSSLAEVALEHIGALYGVERAIHAEGLDVKLATARRQQESKPRLLALHAWLLAQRARVRQGHGLRAQTLARADALCR